MTKGVCGAGCTPAAPRPRPIPTDLSPACPWLCRARARARRARVACTRRCRDGAHARGARARAEPALAPKRAATRADSRACSAVIGCGYGGGSRSRKARVRRAHAREVIARRARVSARRRRARARRRPARRAPARGAYNEAIDRRSAWGAARGGAIARTAGARARKKEMLLPPLGMAGRTSPPVSIFLTQVRPRSAPRHPTLPPSRRDYAARRALRGAPPFLPAGSAWGDHILPPPGGRARHG